MEPFEPFEPRSSGFRRLEKWLATARNIQPTEVTPNVVRAYRTCNASNVHYPNSAEILSAVVGRELLRGTITERDKKKFQALSAKWENRPVQVLQGSWRTHLEQLGCPQGLAYPWIFSMDPMTFVSDPDVGEPPDDAKLRPSDLELLQPVLQSYFASQQPGAAAIFCYSLQRMSRANAYGSFKCSMACIAARLRCYHDFCEVPLSNRHVGAILSMNDNLIHKTVAEWNREAR
jgi:hypothetical protein